MATELERGGRIERCLPDRNESTNRLAVLGRTFNSFIGQSKALLGDMHDEHPL
jgi:hypothetical protein